MPVSLENAQSKVGGMLLQQLMYSVDRRNQRVLLRRQIDPHR